jgi:choline-glycine betaine transporter
VTPEFTAVDGDFRLGFMVVVWASRLEAKAGATALYHAKTRNAVRHQAVVKVLPFSLVNLLPFYGLLVDRIR